MVDDLDDDEGPAIKAGGDEVGAQEISFELERFEWPTWTPRGRGPGMGVPLGSPPRRSAGQVDGERRRLRALPGESPGAPERWAAAFP